MNEKSYYIEYVTIEHQVKVTAIDPDTGTEATVICPKSATKKELTDFAIKKLKYVMNKKQNTKSE